jgi:hypothetical protein
MWVSMMGMLEGCTRVSGATPTAVTRARNSRRCIGEILSLPALDQCCRHHIRS